LPAVADLTGGIVVAGGFGMTGTALPGDDAGGLLLAGGGGGGAGGVLTAACDEFPSARAGAPAALRRSLNRTKFVPILITSPSRSGRGSFTGA
jgi:hypothetical protein